MIVAESAAGLKRFIAKTGLNKLTQFLAVRIVLAFIFNEGRMSFPRFQAPRLVDLIEARSRRTLQSSSRRDYDTFEAQKRQIQNTVNKMN
jgi:hypothetical protein